MRADSSCKPIYQVHFKTSSGIVFVSEGLFALLTLWTLRNWWLSLVVCSVSNFEGCQVQAQLNLSHVDVSLGKVELVHQNFKSTNKLELHFVFAYLPVCDTYLQKDTVVV